eukprot:5278042-Amphidinium_carterae.1
MLRMCKYFWLSVSCRRIAPNRKSKSPWNNTKCIVWVLYTLEYSTVIVKETFPSRLAHSKEDEVHIAGGWRLVFRRQGGRDTAITHLGTWVSQVNGHLHLSRRGSCDSEDDYSEEGTEGDWEDEEEEDEEVSGSATPPSRKVVDFAD